MKSTKYFALLLLLFVSFSCAKENSLENVLAPEDFLNLSYGSNSANTMDVYLPANRSGTEKVIVFVHGGSWFEGDKGSFTDLAKFYRDKGYVTASINYRLSHTSENNIHPAQVTDIGKAINYISSKASEWKVSADKFALFGASAGAHLSLLYTYAFNSDDKVKTVISMAGPANFTDTRNANPLQYAVVEWLLGTSLQANPTIYQQASPYFNINAITKPTLLFHGKLDIVVPVQQSVDLKAKLDQFQVKNKLVIYESTGHEVINPASTLAFLAECTAWLQDNL